MNSLVKKSMINLITALSNQYTTDDLSDKSEEDLRRILKQSMDEYVKNNFEILFGKGAKQEDLIQSDLSDLAKVSSENISTVNRIERDFIRNTIFNNNLRIERDVIHENLTDLEYRTLKTINNKISSVNSAIQSLDKKVSQLEERLNTENNNKLGSDENIEIV